MDKARLLTHYEGCWRHEGHHACAVVKVEQLQVGLNQLRRELHDGRVQRDEWEKMYQQAIAGTEVERLRERLEHWKHISLKVAQMERSKQLAEVEQLLKTALDHEVDSRVRAELEAERLERRLARAEAQVAAVKEATEWLWGFWDGNTLVARSSGYEENIGAAWNKLLETSGAFSKSRKQSTEQHAESLAALVTPELAELLEWLLRVVKDAGALFYSNSRLAAADKLAARIREALASEVIE